MIGVKVTTGICMHIASDNVFMSIFNYLIKRKRFERLLLGKILIIMRLGVSQEICGTSYLVNYNEVLGGNQCMNGSIYRSNFDLKIAIHEITNITSESVGIDWLMILVTINLTTLINKH